MSKRHNLYIIGASNFGREMESWLQLIPPGERDWELKRIEQRWVLVVWL